MKHSLNTPLQLEKILENCALPIMICNSDLCVTWVNQSFTEITGVNKEIWEQQLLTATLKNYLETSDYLKIEQLLLNPSIISAECCFINQNKKWLKWEVSRDTQLGYSLLTLQDISEEIKKRNVVALTQTLSEKYLTQTNANDFFNSVLTQLLMVTESEYGFIGEVFFDNGAPYLKTFAITNIAWNKDTHDFYNQYAPTGMEFRNLKTLFGYAMVSKKPVITNEPSKHPQKGGIPPGHPALNAFLGIPVILSNGEMVGLIGVANKPSGYSEKDVDELKLFLELLGAIIQSKKNAQQKIEIENTLKETLSEKDALLQALNNSAIVSVTDLSGKIIQVNKMFCEVSGFTEKELVGRNHRVLNSGFHDKAFWKDLWDQILAGKPWRAEVCNKAKNGSIFWVDTIVNPIYDAHGKISQFLAIRNLITQRKEAEEHLAKAKTLAEASLRTKRRFLANISHEIRTPLHAILGMGEQMAHHLKDEQQQEQMKLVNDSAKVLLNIINDILDISRMEEGKLKLEHVAFDLHDTINGVFKLLRSYAQEKKLHFELIYDPELERVVLGDPVRLRQVLINILGNAIKFTEKGGVRLKCRASQKKDKHLMVGFICEDTGVGISEEMKKRMFQEFSQEDETFQRKFGGSGLGLAITNELVKLMDGNIEIHSEKNAGTQVLIDIPFEINEQPEKPIVSEPKIEKEKLYNCKVLVAEDNQFNRVLIQIILNNNHIQYDMANNGLEAYEKAQNDFYDIILMDIQMPEMDGIEAMQKIRDEKGKDIPIIAVTAHAIPEELNHYLELGFSDFITKPFNEETLLSKLVKFV